MAWLTEHAADTRTKILLITHTEPSATTQERRQQPPSRELTDTLRAHLPWHQHLGAETSTAAQQATPTAIDRARTHLETTSPTKQSGTADQAQARELLQHADRLTDNYQYRIKRTVIDVDHSRSRSAGLEL
ncbi:hypothetical protein [Mycolicibacterium mageritense]|uniref:hypothetical protein n=1 Tax=Mycolicibacterium mageritense TaxID=53462 RepID=UPI001E38E87C|nr:hypothetical protein [Mycolicibacterium mageritense]GJJ24056.1 hypothetical protein MTY414_77300 [Mycolicibacterium mageritense]